MSCDSANNSPGRCSWEIVLISQEESINGISASIHPQEGLTDISIMVVGNKADLEDLRMVPKEAAEQVSTLANIQN